MGIIHESLVSPQEPASEYANRQLSSFKQIFNNELQIFLQNELNRVDLIRPEATQILADGIEFALREGKRLRPAFMYFSYVGFNGDGNDDEEIVLVPGFLGCRLNFGKKERAG